MYITTLSIIYYLPVYSYTDYNWRDQVDLKVEWIEIEYSSHYNAD